MDAGRFPSFIARVCFRRYVGLLLPCWLILSGCSSDVWVNHVPLDTLMHEGTQVDPSASPGLATTQGLTKAMEFWRTCAPAPAAYHIGEGDELEVGISDLDTPGEVTVLRRTVARGVVAMPLIGEMRVSGFTPREFEDDVEKRYTGGFLKSPDPSVKVVAYRGSPMLIMGAVFTPGMHGMRADTCYVLDALQCAGGLCRNADDHAFVIRNACSPRAESAGSTPNPEPEPDATPVKGRLRDRKTPATNPVPNVASISIHALLSEADMSVNVPIERGDLVAIPFRDKNALFVLGCVEKPGAIQLKPGAALPAMRAVSICGGFTPQSDPRACFLLPVGANLPTPVLRVDLAKVASGESADVPLHNGDTLIVGFAADTPVESPSPGAVSMVSR